MSAALDYFRRRYSDHTKESKRDAGSPMLNQLNGFLGLAIFAKLRELEVLETSYDPFLNFQI